MKSKRIKCLQKEIVNPYCFNNGSISIFKPNCSYKSFISVYKLLYLITNQLYFIFNT